MAISPQILKMNDTEVVVKMYGSNDNGTIDLSTLIPATQALSGATQTVNINKVEWAGTDASTVAITRNTTGVLTFDATGSDALEFGAGYSDTTANTEDITVTVTGTVAVYLTLRKVSGYANKVETAQFSVYDDVTTVGG